MSGAGTTARARYLERMERIAPGAVLARRDRHWTVKKLTHHDGAVNLTLVSGRRTFRAHVTLSWSGPDLWEAGLRVVSPPPSQRALFGAQRGAA